MRIGVFADIHGNIFAFEKVMESLKKEKLDMYLFCGDICGYYYYQDEVIDVLKEMDNLKCIAGNHDRFFLETLKDPSLSMAYEEEYGRSHSLLKNGIKLSSLEWIKQLPDKWVSGEDELAAFHGSPWDHLNEYIYPDSSFEKFADLSYKYVILGHTHHPMDVSIGGVRIINPGSCGQPRDYNEPSYAVLDTDRDSVTFKRVKYDVDLMINEVKKRKEKNPRLAEVLQRKVKKSV